MNTILIDEQNRLLSKLNILHNDKKFLEESNTDKRSKTNELVIIENKINEINDRLSVLDDLMTFKDIKVLFSNYTKELEKISKRYYYLQSLESVISN